MLDQQLNEDTKRMMRLQYELSLKNVEFLDSYIPRSLALFVALDVGIIASAEKLPGQHGILAGVIAIVGLFVLLLMRRVSHLAEEQKQNLSRIESHFPGSENTSAIPKAWGTWSSTSNISQVITVLLSALSCYALMSP